MSEHTASSPSYDLCVIGCGPGGYAAAMRALDAGKRVCIVEGDEIGGAGVKWGALASKTMWELAKDYRVAAMTDRGYRAAGLGVDYRELRRTVQQAVEEKQCQMRSQLETFAPARWRGPGALTYTPGWARFTGPRQVAVEAPGGSRHTVAADNFLVATGSRPRHVDLAPVDQERIFDSDGILQLTDFPRRLMIIGAGIIGCEYATIFASLQQTKVFLVDHAESVIPYEDDDVSTFVSGCLENLGVSILHSTILTRVVHHAGYLEVFLDVADGHAEVMRVDAMLVAVGRVPRLGGLGLETLGIQADRRGILSTDANCRVQAGIYAAGDVTHHPNLVNMAEMEGRYAVKHMFGLQRWPLNYRNLSTVMFFQPPVAAVGLNEKACRRRNLAYRVAHYPNCLLSRAIAMRAATGFVKIIVSDDDQGRILGMRAAGPQASTTIMSIAMLMDQETGLGEALKSVHPHPTMSEGIQECLRLLLGKSIYKPTAFPGQIRIRRWRPDSGAAAP